MLFATRFGAPMPRRDARPGVPRMWTRGPHAQNAGPRPGLGPGRQAMLPPARLAGLPTWPWRRSASPPAAPNGQIARRPGPGARPESFRPAVGIIPTRGRKLPTLGRKELAYPEPALGLRMLADSGASSGWEAPGAARAVMRARLTGCGAREAARAGRGARGERKSRPFRAPPPPRAHFPF